MYALQEMQRAIASDKAATVPSIAACVLLAIADMLMGQELHALVHLGGSLALVWQRYQSTVDASHRGNMDDGVPMIDMLDAAALIFDITTAAYALDLEPRLPAPMIRACSFRSPQSLEDLELRALQTLAFWLLLRS